MDTVDQLRAFAVCHSLKEYASLKLAMRQIGFVQADPIRAPARAQDLILRHRVAGYKAGDLDRRYHSLDIEEDFLHNYGFVARDVWRLLHPRSMKPLTALDWRVLEFVRDAGRIHPDELGATFGRARVVNAWGGYSQATKDSLERLHDRGLLRVARRDKGIRVYEAISLTVESHLPEVRLESLMMLVAKQLTPVPEKTLLSVGARLKRWIGKAPEHRKVLRRLIAAGQLERHVVDEIVYLWPTGAGRRTGEAERRVRILAPFDPVVWDRARFEHLWGWNYRFEAYTPVARRVRGYYAMPLLWVDRVIGWANASVVEGKLRVETGFMGAKPRGSEFSRELEAEIGRLGEFLGL